MPLEAADRPAPGRHTTAMMLSLNPSKDQDALLLSSLETASQNWVAFEWNAKLQSFEATLAQSKEARESSLAARKQLADTTKQFKRSVKSMEQVKLTLQTEGSPEAVAAAVSAMDGLVPECKAVVKSYQEEIDNLTKRCKLSEGAYSSLCLALGQVPDPSAVLSTIMDTMRSQQQQIADLTREAENFQKENVQLKASQKNKQSESSGNFSKGEREELVQLRREVAEYEVEFRSLKNQDITIRKLEARIVELQGEAQEEMEEKLEKARQELAETEGRRAAEALEREAAMERRVENLELQLRAERAGREAAQSHLLDADEGAGEREAAWEAQRRILVDDAERLRQELHHATRERDELRLKVEAVSGRKVGTKTPPPSGGISMQDFMLERTAYEAEVAELSHTVNSLREELKFKDDSVVEERRALQAKIDALERENANIKLTISSLESQLAAAPSQSLLNSMKRELRILKRLEYNANDIDAPEDPEMTGGDPADGNEQDLESVLVAKLRRSESDLVKERTDKLEAVKELDRLQGEIEEAMKSKEEADKLVQSLEKDLERAIGSNPMASPTKVRKTVNIPIPEETASTLSNILDPDASSAPDSSNPPVATKTTAAVEKEEDDHSVATIIMAQRDRLRARCEALEAERDSFKRELQVQVSSAESLKADNTKLYEKVRYLQNFSNSGGNRAAPFKRGGADRDLDLEALEQRYEASVDPFRQFSRHERQRKLQEMQPMERVVFIVAKTVLGTKAMRMALFVYVTCMHLLVFITTYHWSHTGCESIHDHEHLAHLPPAVHEAAKEAMRNAQSGVG